jgi:hypothetical protein
LAEDAVVSVTQGPGIMPGKPTADQAIGLAKMLF